MKIRTLLIVAIAVLITPAAHALQIPKSSAGDPRIKTVDYKPDEVVRINSFIGIGTYVRFSRGERIINKALGYSSGWAFEDKGDSFYIKPKVEHGDTNLMVQTNRRTYDFELIAYPDWKKKANDRLPHDSRMCFRLQFLYPDDAETRLNKIAADIETKNRLNTSKAPRNWNYTMMVGKNSREIAPSMAYDDGTFTYLKFPNNRRIPAVFEVAENGEESLINMHFVGDVVVIHRIGKQFYLRFAREVVGLYNEAYDPDGVPATEGTTVPGIKRRIKGETDGI